MRVGQGFDVHAFTEGDHLMLGGVRIEFDKAFAAHSDGDVLLHAISDALLGAAGLGDIGHHFPDTDPVFSGADSRDLLRQVIGKLAENGYVVGNIDATIVAQAPKMQGHLPAMIAHIAQDTQISESDVNIKATTTEWLGFCGRGEGIASMAAVTIHKASAH